MGSPQIYDNADRAAVDRYNAARQQGMDDQAAREESFKEWWSSVQGQRRARGVYQFPGLFPAEPGGGPWQEWVPEGPIGGPSPPPGSPPPGASPMGTSVGGTSPPPGSPPPGGSPMASSTGPGAAPAPAPAPGAAPSPLSEAQRAVGFGGLTGPD
jgi:hypothetical protein